MQYTLDSYVTTYVHMCFIVIAFEFNYIPVIATMSMGCQGHELSLQRRETVILNMEAVQPARYQEQKWVTFFQSCGIKKQEGYMQVGNGFVTYAAAVPSPQRAKHMIRKIAMGLPEFIDDEDRQMIEDVIDSSMAEARKKREFTIPTSVEIQVNFYPVQFSLLIE